MKYSFTDNSADIKSIQKNGNFNQFLIENNSNQINEICNFFNSNEKLLLINGFIGTGKTSVCDYCLNFLNTNCIVLKYDCFETTILDDILLVFFDEFKKLSVLGKIKPPKIKSDNFAKKINTYFESIEKPILVIINSFEEILKSNKPEIIEFIKHLMRMNNVKVILISRAFKSGEIDMPNKKVTILALEKSLFEKYLRSQDFKQIGPLSDELYKHTRGYFFYINLSIKIMKLKQLQLIDFLDLFAKSLVTFNDFILREALSFVDPVSGHLFRFLTIMRHPVNIRLLKSLHLYDKQKTDFFVENLLLSRIGDSLYLQDYYRVIAENSIPENVSIKIHHGCVELYNTQLPLKPLERDLLLSRQTMRNEIEYHSMFIPQQKFVLSATLKADEEKQGIVEKADEDVEHNITEDKNEKIKNMSFVFDDDSAGTLDKIADSIKDYVSYKDIRKQEEQEDNKLSLSELLNKAKLEENNFNFRHVVNLYQKALLLKNDDDYYTYLPMIYTKMAFGYQNLSDLYNAQKYFEKAKEFYQSTGDVEKICSTKYNIAKILYMSFKKDNAIAILKDILKHDTSDDLKVKTLNLLANLSTDLMVSKRYYETALQMSPMNVDKTAIAELYFKYALTCEELNDEETAVTYYKKCLEIKDNPFVSDTLSNIALLYDDLGDSVRALKYYKESLEIDEKNKNLNGIYTTCMKMAEIYAPKSTETSLELYNKALQTAQMLNETFYIISASIALGDFYFDRKDDNLAFEHYQRAYELVKSGQYTDNIEKIAQRIEDIKLRSQVGG